MDIVRICDRVIRSAFYFLFLLTPFLFNPSTVWPSFELFEWNKMMFVYLITVTLITSWIIKMIAVRKFIFNRTPLFWPMLFFLATQIIATVFSIDPHLSIWGYYSRFHGGLLSTIAYVTLYFAFVSNLKFINLRQFLFLLLTSASLVSLYGIAQKFGIDEHKWVQDVQNRVFSTLGQPNWLAAYLAVLIPISLSQHLSYLRNLKQSQNYEIQNSKFKIQNFRSKFKIIGLLDNWYYWIIGLLLYICLLFTKSRSGFLGFWGANSVFWLITFYLSSPSTSLRVNSESRNFLNKVSSRLPARQMLLHQVNAGGRSNNNLFRIFLIVNFTFLILNFLIKTPLSQYNRIATVEIFSRQPVVEETKAPIGDSVINVGITDSSEIRKIVWQGAVEIIKNYPLFGTGPETFAFAYYRFRPVAHNLTSEWDFLYNRAHNEFLNIASNSGLIGLTTYLLLITAIFIELARRIRKQGSNQFFFSAVLAAYVSILITNFFGFSVVIVGLFFFLLPVLIFTNTKKHSISSVSNLSNWTNLPNLRKIGVLVTILLGLTGIGYLGKLWVADSTYAKAISYSRAGELDLAYQKIVTATDLRGDEPNFHDQRADIAGNYATALMETDATRSAQLFQDAVGESSKALTISPQNVNFWKTRTRILFALSEVDEAFLNQALGAIQLAMELSPTDPKLTYNAAIIYGRLNRSDDAIKLLQKTIELKADYRDAYIALSIFYIEQKDLARAREVLNQILEKINPNDEEVKQRLEEIK